MINGDYMISKSDHRVVCSHHFGHELVEFLFIVRYPKKPKLLNV